MKMPHDCNNINDVRSSIDETDNAIIELIAKRLSYIREIVKYKNNIKEVYAKKRHETVLLSRRKIAEGNKLDPDVIENMFRIIMDYSVREQLELLEQKQHRHVQK